MFAYVTLRRSMTSNVSISDNTQVYSEHYLHLWRYAGPWWVMLISMTVCRSMMSYAYIHDVMQGHDVMSNVYIRDGMQVHDELCLYPGRYAGPWWEMFTSMTVCRPMMNYAYIHDVKQIHTKQCLHPWRCSGPWWIILVFMTLCSSIMTCSH
jgi:hypothetical protein